MSIDAQTVSGKRVIYLVYEAIGSAGNKVTFPIKGTIVVREKPWKTEYQIWTPGGKARPIGDHPDDLRVVPKELNIPVED